jgi:hypothetical protein
VAFIRPVAKIGTPSGPSDFRPVSIVSVLSKAVVCIFNDQVLDHVNGRNLLLDFQSSFRRGHSTTTALVRVTEDLRSVKAEGKITVHVLLHFSKTCDLINHGLFVHKLDSRYDCHTSAMGMVSSFLRDRSMVVEVDYEKLTQRYLSYGVPQAGAVYKSLCGISYKKFFKIPQRPLFVTFGMGDLIFHQSVRGLWC